ncbi:uncharacterized protein EV420DRAFT_1186052 [Desarmillaria tabescens]|uniref:Uncharacterized protein n=1 Tax=Armillaria tabescens TaxID=1929756 RepID=A0AA39NB67_ARMTA|nr:uncharacterized protein EV420DRAFT_1186052 [Desarmillaria tabescens]KAK0462421.1 hypothetical protein EV420DRAFT_1186052 [Desarmillaria tabescens]
MRLYLTWLFILLVSISVSGMPAPGKAHKKYLTIDRYIPALNEAGAFRGASGVAAYEKTFEKCVEVALDTLILWAKDMERTPRNIRAAGFKFLFDPTTEDADSEPTLAKFDFQRISWEDSTATAIAAKAPQFKESIQKVFKEKLAAFEAELRKGTQKGPSSGSAGS